MVSLFATQHPVADLRSVEDVRLDLDVALALRIADPVRFDTQFAALDGGFDETRLA